MQLVSPWEAVLIGVVALLVTLWLRPGIKAAFKQSREVEYKDWQGVFLPLVLVTLFVILLIAMV